MATSSSFASVQILKRDQTIYILNYGYYLCSLQYVSQFSITFCFTMDIF